MMDKKHQVLIADHQEEWRTTLARTLPGDAFVITTAATYKEAIHALDTTSYALLIIDPFPEPSGGRKKQTNVLEGLDMLKSAAERFPDMDIIVLTREKSRLDGVSTLPSPVHIFEKVQWDKTAFLGTVHQLMHGSPPLASEITRHPDPVHGKATGLTGPLNTGLTPPPLGTRSGKPRVLIIDHGAVWQDKMGSMMEHEGYFWRVAATYEDAMERLNADTFHIVLLDLMLGGPEVPIRKGQGWHLLDYLVKEFPKTKVIILSGEASGRDIAKLFTDYPIKGFIDKDNFEEREMLTLIHEQLAGPTLKIQSLGGFRVWRNGSMITDFGEEKGEVILKLLVTRHGEKVNADELAERLFPGVRPQDCYTPLVAIVNRLRLALEPDLPRPGDSNFIIRTGNQYTFNFLANVDMDADQFRRLVTEARQHDRRGENEEALKDYEAARALYTGEYLPNNRSEQWALQERSLLQGLYTSALNRIADLNAEKGNLDAAIAAANRSLQADAYNESTYRRLMRYHYCKNDLAAAMQIYKVLTKLFSEFFQEEPDAITRRLVEDMNHGRSVSCVEVVSVSGEWRVASDR
jgi:DNA-binding SARP family transcriptional activator/DNA-binding NarL/FixJ family response regulator